MAPQAIEIEAEIARREQQAMEDPVYRQEMLDRLDMLMGTAENGWAAAMGGELTADELAAEKKADDEMRARREDWAARREEGDGVPVRRPARSPCARPCWIASMLDCGAISQ